MQNKILLIVCILTSFAFAEIEEETAPTNYVDLGIHGKLYDIKENDILFQIEQTAKNFKIDQDQIKKDIEAQVAAAANKTTKLPLCDKDEKEPAQTDFYTVPMDIINPMGRLIVKKGDRMRSKLPQGAELNLCFIDARNQISGENQIKSFAKNNPKCLFLVANADVRDLREKFPNLDIYPTSEMQETRFGLKCFPSKLHMEGDQKQFTYYNYESFSKDVRTIE